MSKTLEELEKMSEADRVITILQEGFNRIHKLGAKGKTREDVLPDVTAIMIVAAPLMAALSEKDQYIVSIWLLEREIELKKKKLKEQRKKLEAME